MLLLIPLLHALKASAQVTLYTGRPSHDSAASATRPADATWTGLPMYDPLMLTPPEPPSPPVGAVAHTIPPNSAALASGDNPRYLSIPQKGNFLGFSVELSVADSLMGLTGRTLKPEFLNYLGNIFARAGSGPVVRVGGNTQDNSTIMPDGLPGGVAIEKIREVGIGPTETPWINYSPALLYTMSNISSLVQTEWYFGLAFNYTDATLDWHNIPIAADYAQRILGRYLKGLPLGNEPDLYTDHGKRPEGWTIGDYVNEWTSVSQRILDNTNLPNPELFLGPSTCCNRVGFELPDVINTGWLTDNSNKLGQISVQHYPNNNCQLNDRIINPQDIFAGYLNHTGVVALTAQYANDMTLTQAAGKEMVMLEMNTASCGGFPGLSTSFGAALWMVDWSLQMAHYNFSQALMHVGGQNVYYNPFTPPPGNMSNVYQWTTGAVYYSTLVMAETFGRSNASRVVDISTDELRPAYAVYEEDAPSRVVLLNYVSDPSGASTYTAQLTTGATQVHVRYLLSPSVAEHDNITWAGQTMRGSYASDGRLHGDVETSTISCAEGVCAIPVPAPAIAVVYLNDGALQRSTPPENARQSFETTVLGWGSATIDAGALETSNGQNGPDGVSGRNNRATGAAGGGKEVRAITGLGVAIVVMVAGMVLVKLERQL